VKVVWLQVELLEGRDDSDDAAGLWEVELHDEVAEEGIAVGAALDVFHRSVAVSELEDYEITALHPETLVVLSESESYVQGSGPDGEVDRIGDRSIPTFSL
jgi:hypothetical protein